MCNSMDVVFALCREMSVRSPQYSPTMASNKYILMMKPLDLDAKQFN